MIFVKIKRIYASKKKITLKCEATISTWFFVLLILIGLSWLGIDRYISYYNQKQGKYYVTRVIDGDTIVLKNGVKVRYIGIDTPEMHDANPQKRCWAYKAYEFNKELVEHRWVRLETDVDFKDRNGRLLAYVYVDSPNTSGEIFVNKELVLQGLAFAVTYPPNVKHQKELMQAQEYAREHKLGFWGDTQCKIQ